MAVFRFVFIVLATLVSAPCSGATTSVQMDRVWKRALQDGRDVIDLRLVCAAYKMPGDASFDQLRERARSEPDDLALLLSFDAGIGVDNVRELIARLGWSDRLSDCASSSPQPDAETTTLIRIDLADSRLAIRDFRALRRSADVRYFDVACRYPMVAQVAAPGCKSYGATCLPPTENCLLNDPLFCDGAFWGLESVRALEAWQSGKHEITKTVAVIDQGIDASHFDLQGSILPGFEKATFNDYCPGTTTALDQCVASHDGHGTGVTGVIAASGQNKTGGVGVAWRARVVAVRVGEIAAGGYRGPTVCDFKRAIDYSVAAEASIVNLSQWTGSQGHPALYNAIREAKHVLFVIAAGNDPKNYDSQLVYPAAFDLDNIISVTGIVRHNDCQQQPEMAALAWDPEGVDLAAPGSGICSTYKGGYARLNGTSFAAPFVTAAAGLIWSQPEYAQATALQVKSLIEQYAVRPSQDSTFVNVDGQGTAATVFGGTLDLSFLATHPLPPLPP